MSCENTGTNITMFTSDEPQSNENVSFCVCIREIFKHNKALRSLYAGNPRNGPHFQIFEFSIF